MRSIRMREDATVQEIAEIAVREGMAIWTNGEIVEVTNCPPPGYHLMGVKMRDADFWNDNDG